MPHARTALLSALLLSFAAVSCTASATPQSEYGADADYYMALRSIGDKDFDTAARLLKHSSKKGSPMVARRSLEALSELGSVSERTQNLVALYRTYGDEDALLRLCRELDADREYADIIRYTEGVDVATCSQELAYYKCTALIRKNDSRAGRELLRWCTERPFGDFQYALCSGIEEPDPLIAFRILVYEKKYDAACKTARLVLAEPETLVPQIASDIGKSFLYGSSQYAANASLLDSLAGAVPGDCEFYVRFYAGRLYEKAGSTSARIRDRLSLAMQAAYTEQLFDNACWYYLSAALKSSTEEAVSELEAYRTRWHDPYYYDDFLDTLSLRLISEHAWNDYYRVATLIDGYASDETVAKYSYLSARFIQSGYVSFSGASGPVVEVLLRRALSSGSDFYYRLLSATALGLSADEVDDAIRSFGLRTGYVPDEDCERLMNGYADFGLPEYIYPEWRLLDASLGTECVVRLSGFLKDCAENAGGTADSYYEQSIRMASRRANYPEEQLGTGLLSLAYPRDFAPQVSSAAGQFGLSESLLYALIRSESFFAPAVTSHASAMGLTQLMEATAADIARKLRMADYDIADPETNILFGAYYLAEMRERLDGSTLHALFAYNGGLTRVRSWRKSAALEFGTDSLPDDIFLEALPYAETREYGRKVTAAAALYGWLYYGTPVADTVRLVMRTEGM